MIQSFIVPHYSTMQMPIAVTVPTYMQFQGFLEGCRIEPFGEKVLEILRSVAVSSRAFDPDQAVFTLDSEAV
ncbi:hypothetical protein D3Y55_23910 [Mesorhizobium sp. DCY119]|nr:hypothetical protein D3Y55_23910 [Mesorhizobium sp. DCY119]